MRRIDLDFVRRRPGWPGWLVGAVGLAIAIDALSTYHARVDELARRTESVRLQVGHTRPAETLSTDSQREYDAARRLLSEMALPWESLFRTIEVSLGKDVALLGLEPDAQRRSLLISGEARNYLALLSFVARLNGGPVLSRVHLVEHAARKDMPEQPLRFTLMANWGTPP